MMTAMLCAENILAGEAVYDLWKVNQDAEYHEAGARSAAASGASGIRWWRSGSAARHGGGGVRAQASPGAARRARHRPFAAALHPARDPVRRSGAPARRLADGRAPPPPHPRLLRAPSAAALARAGNPVPARDRRPRGDVRGPRAGDRLRRDLDVGPLRARPPLVGGSRAGATRRRRFSSSPSSSSSRSTSSWSGRRRWPPLSSPSPCSAGRPLHGLASPPSQRASCSPSACAASPRFALLAPVFLLGGKGPDGRGSSPPHGAAAAAQRPSPSSAPGRRWC